MSLVTQLNAAFTRIATEFKSVRSTIGLPASLNTVEKASLVGAINEVNTKTANAGAQINDTGTSTTSVWSSSKTESVTDAIDTKATNAQTAANSKAAINDTTASTTSTYSSTKINSAISTAVGAKPSIDDAAPSTSAVYSSSKVETRISDSVAALVGGAPAALDTLAELAAALGDSPDAITSINTALGLRVRVDAAQAFTAGQQAQGRSNIGAVSSVDVGDTATDFVATFEAALA